MAKAYNTYSILGYTVDQDTKSLNIHFVNRWNHRVSVTLDKEGVAQVDQAFLDFYDMLAG